VNARKMAHWRSWALRGTSCDETRDRYLSVFLKKGKPPYPTTSANHQNV
jgi:hypothetical protein